MVVRHLDEPRPILHAFGDRPCGGVALLALAEVDPEDRVFSSILLHADNEIVDPHSPFPGTCGSCGRTLHQDNLLQVLRGYEIHGLDQFRLAIHAAVLRSTPRADPPVPVDRRVRLRTNTS